MGRLSTAFLVLALGATMAGGLTACGSSGGAELLPGGTASEISSNLDKVRVLAGEGECIGAQDAALEVSDQIDALGGVDKQLKLALREGAERLNEVVSACEEAPDETEPAIANESPVEAEEETEEKHGKAEEGKQPKQEREPEGETPETKAETTPHPTTEPSPSPTETAAEPPVAEGGSPSGGVGPGAPVGSE